MQNIDEKNYVFRFIINYFGVPILLWDFKITQPLHTVVRRRPDIDFKSGDHSRQANDLK